MTRLFPALLFVPALLQAQTSDSAKVAKDSVAHTLTTVSITGARDKQTYRAEASGLALRTETALRDTPHAVSVVTRAAFQDQGVRTMADVARMLPGVQVGLGEGHRDAVTIRGNSSTADFFVDGVRDDAQYLRDLYNVEQVEALRGPSALAFGRGGGGGLLNRTMKSAPWSRVTRLDIERGGFGGSRMSVDVGRPAGRAMSARLNAMVSDMPSYRAHSDVDRAGVNPVATARVRGVVVTAGYEFFRDRRVVDRGVPSVAGAPWLGDSRAFFGNPDTNRASMNAHVASMRIARPFGGALLLRTSLRAANYDKFYQNTYASASANSGTQAVLQGYNHAIDRRNLLSATDITLRARTGAASHTLLAGVDAGRQVTSQFRNTGYWNNTSTSLTTPIGAADVATPVTFRQSASDANSRAVVLSGGVFAQDQVQLGLVQLVGGIRYDGFGIRYTNRRDASTLERHDRSWSPRLGVIVRPVEPVSLYGSVSTSFLPGSGDQFTALSVTTQGLEPERFTNREIGLRLEPSSQLTVTTAFFRLDRTNTTAPDPVDASRVVQTGAQRTQGIELELVGKLASWWQVTAQASGQDARIVSRTSAAPAGARVPLVPHASGSLWNRVELSRALAVGLGYERRARSYAAIDNTVVLPGFARVDAALFVRPLSGVTVQANAENITNRRYFPTSQGNNNIMPGAPRSVRLAVAIAN